MQRVRFKIPTQKAEMAYQIVHIACNAAAKDKAPISFGIQRIPPEIVHGKFEGKHDTDKIDIDDVHARFCRSSRGVLVKYESGCCNLDNLSTVCKYTF